MEKFIPLEFHKRTEEDQASRVKEMFALLNSRRSIREFTDQPVPEELINDIVRTASTAPSGANKQPWTFCLVSNPEIKSKIREAAEKEEYVNYNGRMSDRWLEDLEPFGTDWKKPFLETAPYLIVVFKRAYEMIDGEKRNNYYVNESVGLACGMLIAAIHNAGLCCLTHTPSPMNFLTSVLERPENERPFLLIPVGYPADDAKVPNIKRKELDDIVVRYP